MLLDTNIVGYFFRGDSRAKPYERHLTGQARCIAFVTLGELHRHSSRTTENTSSMSPD